MNLKMLENDWAKSVLPASVVFFLPFGSLIFLPLVIMALCGIYILYREVKHKSFDVTKYKFLFIAFLLIWAPMLFSLTDAANIRHSASSTLSVLPYFFVGVYIIDTLKSQTARDYLNRLILLVTLFWCMDAMFQLFTGTDFFGHGYLSKNRLSGIFYPRYTLGLVLVLFFPVVLEELRRFSKNNTWVIISIIFASIYIAVIILSGSRNAAVMLVIGIIAWLAYVMYISGLFHWKKILISLILGIPLVFILLSMQPTRIDTMVQIPSLNIKTLDKLSNHRLPLWEAASGMAIDHWINGIGPRGFRHVYNQYKPEKRKFGYEYSHASTHPHFALLEIAAETGIIGLICIAIMLFSIFNRLKKVSKFDKLAAYPWFLGVTLAIVPNVAKAFYSSFWMTIILCMLFVGIANSTYHQKSY